MSQFALAMHNYHEVHGTLPPAAVCGYDGQPLLSWRVLILPFIEQEELFKQFHLDEPWDSPHNLALLPRMPRIYAPPGTKARLVPPHHTVCHVFVGRGTPFEGLRGLRLDELTDGTSNTLLFVEAGEPVPWTKPQDLAYDPDGPLPALDGLFRDGIRACMADGSRRFIPKTASEASLRAAITRNGREQVSHEEW